MGRAGRLFTVPVFPAAGEALRVYYRPAAGSPLEGAEALELRGGWNRGRHARREAAELRPVGGGGGGEGYAACTVDVPADASSFEFEVAGTFGGGRVEVDDAGGGRRHRLPVHGARPGGDGDAPPALWVVHVAVELAPLAKVGGLGDVVAALARRTAAEPGHRAEVVMPMYDCVDHGLVDGLERVGAFEWGGTEVEAWAGAVDGVPVTLLRPGNGLFDVGCIYGHYADHERFSFFSHVALAALDHLGKRPDVLHVHDWPTAPVAWLHRGPAPVVLTVHNLAFGADVVGQAMNHVAAATTVSPTYAREIAGHASVAPHAAKLVGIRNGIDPLAWDPAWDPALPAPFDAATWREGKPACAAALRRRLGLAGAGPVVAVVGRLAEQKGLDLIEEACWCATEAPPDGGGAQFVLLGAAADPGVADRFRRLGAAVEARRPGRARVVLEHDDALARLVFAAADVVVVPSRFEPCGLTQLLALRYGAVPVVRATGGLRDTVFDVAGGDPRANGFAFERDDDGGAELRAALRRALGMLRHGDDDGDGEAWGRLVDGGMRQDWGWWGEDGPGEAYLEVYYEVVGEAGEVKHF